MHRRAGTHNGEREASCGGPGPGLATEHSQCKKHEARRAALQRPSVGPTNLQTYTEPRLANQVARRGRGKSGSSAELLVLLGAHQLLELIGVGQLHLDHPALAVGVGVDLRGWGGVG